MNNTPRANLFLGTGIKTIDFSDVIQFDIFATEHDSCIETFLVLAKTAEQKKLLTLSSSITYLIKEGIVLELHGNFQCSRRRRCLSPVETAITAVFANFKSSYLLWEGEVQASLQLCDKIGVPNLNDLLIATAVITTSVKALTAKKVPVRYIPSATDAIANTMSARKTKVYLAGTWLNSPNGTYVVRKSTVANIEDKDLNEIEWLFRTSGCGFTDNSLNVNGLAPISLGNCAIIILMESGFFDGVYLSVVNQVVEARLLTSDGLFKDACSFLISSIELFHKHEIDDCNKHLEVIYNYPFL